MVNFISVLNPVLKISTHKETYGGIVDRSCDVLHMTYLRTYKAAVASEGGIFSQTFFYI